MCSRGHTRILKETLFNSTHDNYHKRLNPHFNLGSHPLRIVSKSVPQTTCRTYKSVYMVNWTASPLLMTNPRYSHQYSQPLTIWFEPFENANEEKKKGASSGNQQKGSQKQARTKPFHFPRTMSSGQSA